MSLSPQLIPATIPRETRARTLALPSRSISAILDMAGSRQLYWVSVLALLAVAATLRFAPLGYDSFSHDELIRLTWVDHGSLADLRWFPPAQAALYSTMHHHLPGSEYVMRSASAVIGLALVVTTLIVVRRHVGTWTALCAAGYVTVHPALLFYSQKFKEFSFDSASTIVLIAFAAPLVGEFTVRRLRVFLVVAVFALCWSYSSVLVVAAWAPFIGWAWYKASTSQRGSVGTLVVLVGTYGMAVIGWYLWLTGCPMRDVAVEYFALNERAWPAGTGLAATADWLLVKTGALFRFLCGASSLWEPRGSQTWLCVSLFALAGLRPVYQRWPAFAGFALTLWLLAICTGLLRQWPYGAYRTACYLVPVFAVFVSAGIVHLARQCRAPLFVALLLIFAAVLPAGRAVKNSVVEPKEYEHLRPVFAAMQSKWRDGDGALIYYGADNALWYYWRDAPSGILVQPRNDRGQFASFRRRVDGLARTYQRTWFVKAHSYKHEGDEWCRYLEQRYPVIERLETRTASALCFDTGARTASAVHTQPSGFTAPDRKPVQDARVLAGSQRLKPSEPDRALASADLIDRKDHQ